MLLDFAFFILVIEGKEAGEIAGFIFTRDVLWNVSVALSLALE